LFCFEKQRRQQAESRCETHCWARLEPGFPDVQLPFHWLRLADRYPDHIFSRLIFTSIFTGVKFN
jgi:hypothetical protein